MNLADIITHKHLTHPSVASCTNLLGIRVRNNSSGTKLLVRVFFFFSEPLNLNLSFPFNLSRLNPGLCGCPELSRTRKPHTHTATKAPFQIPNWPPYRHTRAFGINHLVEQCSRVKLELGREKGMKSIVSQLCIVRCQCNTKAVLDKNSFWYGSPPPT